MKAEQERPGARERLEDAARALFGAHWRRPAARFLGVSRSELRTWGKTEPPAWAVERLEWVRLARRHHVLEDTAGLTPGFSQQKGD